MTRHLLAEKLYAEYSEEMNRAYPSTDEFPPWYKLPSQTKSIWERVADVAITAFPPPERS